MEYVCCGTASQVSDSAGGAGIGTQSPSGWPLIFLEIPNITQTIAPLIISSCATGGMFENFERAHAPAKLTALCKVLPVNRGSFMSSGSDVFAKFECLDMQKGCTIKEIQECLLILRALISNNNNGLKNMLNTKR